MGIHEKITQGETSGRHGPCHDFHHDRVFIGWGTGIRTPTGRVRVCSPTVRRYPSSVVRHTLADECSSQGGRVLHIYWEMGTSGRCRLRPATHGRSVILPSAVRASSRWSPTRSPHAWWLGHGESIVNGSAAARSPTWRPRSGSRRTARR